MRYTVLILVICLSSLNTIAQENEQRTFFAVIVSDFYTSLQWYQEKLKLDLNDSTSVPDRGIKQGNLFSKNFHVELIQINAANPPQQGFNQGLFKVGLTVDNLDAWHQHLKTQKAQFRGELFSDEKTGLRSFIVLDPDGNRIQFFGK